MILSKFRILSLTVLIALVSCSDKNSKAKGQFLSGCIKAGATKSQCSCIFGKLESEYSPEELQQIVQMQSMSEQAQAKMVEIAESCR